MCCMHHDSNSQAYQVSYRFIPSTLRRACALWEQLGLKSMQMTATVNSLCNAHSAALILNVHAKRSCDQQCMQCIFICAVIGIKCKLQLQPTADAQDQLQSDPEYTCWRGKSLQACCHCRMRDSHVARLAEVNAERHLGHLNGDVDVVTTARH